MKTQWVSGLQPGLKVCSSFVVFDLGLAKTKNGAKYLRVTLGDRTGVVEARVWDSGLAEDLYKGIAPGDVAMFSGSVVEFNGLQINIETCLKTDQSDIDLNDYRPCTEQDTAGDACSLLTAHRPGTRSLFRKSCWRQPSAQT